MTVPHRILPAVYVAHKPSLRRLVGSHQIGDRVYIEWRLPIQVGAFVARAITKPAPPAEPEYVPRFWPSPDEPCGWDR